MKIKISDLISTGHSAVVQHKSGYIGPTYYLKRNSNELSRDLYADGYFLPDEKFIIVNAYRQGEVTHMSVANSYDFKVRGYYVPYDQEFDLLENDDLSFAWDEVRKSNVSRYLHHGFTIGSDPEIFVEDRNGNMIPAFLFLGSKEEPNHTAIGDHYGSDGGHPMYWDGFQAEFTTRAGHCLEYHTDSVAAGIKGVYDAARKKFPDARLSCRNVFDISNDMLQTAKEEHVAFGCMPSFNAYGLQVNMPPAREVSFRSAGGHIHFGLGKITNDSAVSIVKALDMIVGVSCVSLFDKFDNRKRRMMYGLPGEYRLPPHGLEYRTLSNAWLIHPFIMNLVIDIARKAVVLSQRGWLDLWVSDEEETIDTIMRCDVEQARKSLETNKKTFINLLSASYIWASQIDLNILYNIFFNGLKSVIHDPNDFVGNWKINGGWFRLARADKCNVSRSMEDLRIGNKL